MRLTLALAAALTAITLTAQANAEPRGDIVVHTPKTKAAPAAHLSLWLCIHNGEGAWNANTGNGYYGGLQMTYGWLGLIAGRASDLSPAAQIAAAERGYAASGYSLRWLRGQWPNTSRRCI